MRGEFRGEREGRLSDMHEFDEHLCGKEITNKDMSSGDQRVIIQGEVIETEMG